MTPERFRNLLLEFIDEDPFALRAVLKLLDVEFTEAVPTLAVTCEQRPRLLVNLAFVKGALPDRRRGEGTICHELLHVLLRHTESRVAATPAWHLAFDAVINAIDPTLGEGGLVYDVALLRRSGRPDEAAEAPDRQRAQQLV